MSAAYNDGTVQYGTIGTTGLITINSVTYAVDNISIDRPSTVIERTNGLGEPSGSVGIAGFVTGSATLQIAASTTAEPPRGQTFTVTFDTTIGSETFNITSVGRAEVKDGEKKFNINFIKDYSA